MEDIPEDPIPVPEGKPFGCRLIKEETLQPEEIRKIDFAALQDADSTEKILLAMGLSGRFHGDRVILRTETYRRIHDTLRTYHPGKASDIMFALAHIGMHTTFDPAVAEDEVWLLAGWKI